MNILLLLLILWPLAGAFFTYQKPGSAPFFLISELVLALAVCLMQPLELTLPSLMLQGIHLQIDGFRALYGLLTATSWLLSGLFSKEYGFVFQRHNRYYAFLLLTLSATMGVFLSANLMTTWIFFEVMSFASYVWVAHEETPQALKASRSYLTYGVAGGLAMLMGLWLLHHQTGTLEMSQLLAACSSLSFSALLPAGLCLLAGFGAKAGMFPLHTWLPQSYPAAPAPATTLLSGILSKAGLFGVVIVTANLFQNSPQWGNLLLILALATMLVGGAQALFSTDLKRTLAFSSMSQIGFILFGVACMSLLGADSSMAASGAALHMVNHTLFKQVLFTLAGVVFLNLGSLSLNDIKGFGRGKPLLLIAFLCAALGLAGVPLMSGYISKTLLHESLIHYMGGHPSSWLKTAEWLFLISGGLTIAYMLKLFTALFIDRPDPTAAAKPKRQPYMTKLTAAALLLPAVVIPVFGLLPHWTMDCIANASLPFFKSGILEKISYFSFSNLSGALISLAIGLLLYFLVVRGLLMKQGRYVDRWPRLLNLEAYLYIPVLLRFLPSLLGGLCRILCDLPDLIVLALRKTIFHEAHSHASPIAHHRLAYYLGSLSDRARENVEGVSDDPAKQHEGAIAFARSSEAFSRTARQIFGNFSFSLLMACIGIGVTLLYLILR